ncbi:anti-sigma factor family protein [Nocardiopsis flavescens]|uniref:Putative zinc-finger n=1 Tax=Nocardiopsis flavescens TaxID=758803 RepID=A0A1M6VPM3_9ACTN|nr:zf-HC2 domain-containing protein [Nocardiopsis flavescens]SHK83443.1 Putative zinc-finger [Nocardiopsis flavescens]
MFERDDPCGAPVAGALVLGALDPAERAGADAHLEGCPSCRERVRELEVVPRALADLPLEEFLTDFLLTPERIGGLARRVLERAAREGEGGAADAPGAQPG